MGIEYTKEQQQVIDLRNRNILVSAAAGSGKTAVLVERIITRLTKDENPLNIDELLVMTYTEAAAAEMKERIRLAIEKALEENPEDLHLQRQSTLVHQAQVTTIHGFCLSVIKEYFHTINLDPGYRVADNGELELMKRDVLEDVLEECYKEQSEAFLDFVECYACGKDDKVIEDMILELYDKSRSYPDPEEWLDSCVANYDIEDENKLEQLAFIKKIVEETHHVARDVENEILFALDICGEEDGPESYISALESDLKLVQKVQRLDSFVELQTELSNISWASLKSNKGKQVSEEKTERVKKIRQDYKVIVGNICGEFFLESPEQVKESMLSVKSNMEVLVNLVKEFICAFQEKKRSKNMIDFSDMEHYALEILTRKENGILIPSKVAEEYQEKFQEVMIDEYQDSNLVQETILTSVSSVSKGKYNIFMVGDVKQSIYRFRLSRPELFMEKYEKYSTEDSSEQRIDLHKNFRSRREVLDASNYVFEQIMTKGLGGITYDSSAALHVGAKYDEMPNNETEICYVDVSEMEQEDTVRDMEARAIAKRIKELVGQHKVLDKNTGTYRTAKYSDIVILCRSIQGWSDVFVSRLDKEGVPAYSVSKEGYFETREIQMLLDYLRILDNPRQDIPFVAVLRSPFLGLSSEELAMIKTGTQGTCFYDITCDYAKSGEDVFLQERLQRFLTQFDMIRDKVPYTAIHTLLWEIFSETGYARYVAALPGGEQREANLEMLVEKAIAFEATSYKGLFHFVRYIEQLNKYKVEQGEASIMEETSDVVRVMTIHKSKGLEFPIVFVAGMAKRFNIRDASGALVIHPDLGVGLEKIDSELRTKESTLLKGVIHHEIQKETVAEELRVLYVAMTRAKEKMILIGTTKDMGKELEKCLFYKKYKQNELPYLRLLKSRTYFDWVTPAVYRNQTMAKVLEAYGYEAPFQNSLYFTQIPIVVKLITRTDMVEQELEEGFQSTFAKEVLKRWDAQETYDLELKEQLEEQMNYVYPHGSEPNFKQKISVSELKKRAYLEEEELEEEVVIPLLPKFVQGEVEVTGATRGTAYHKVMELLDMTKEYDEATLQNAIDEMVSSEKMTMEMVSSVEKEDILKFLSSSIGRRIKLACQKGVFYTEQPFVLADDTLFGEMTLVQGIIDAYFEEDGQLVVVDYKTDRVWNAEELKERYRIQLNYYANALERMKNMPIKEKKIYSFAMHKEIEV